MTRVAVLQLPGSNCERETMRACEAVGLRADLVRWNDPARGLASYDGVVIPGGFAFEDRVRAGALAAKLPVIEVVAEMAERGAGVIGICNGAQILVEAGIVPGFTPGSVEMALAPNENGRSGYDCRWVHVGPAPDAPRSVVTAALEDDAVVPIPIAHGEGRFTARDPDALLARLEAGGRILLRYVDPAGSPGDGPFVNPNGSLGGIAALGNAAGNAAAVMPHPERSTWLHQVPESTPGPWGARRLAARSASALSGAGPGRALFASLREFLEAR